MAEEMCYEIHVKESVKENTFMNLNIYEFKKCITRCTKVRNKKQLACSLVLYSTEFKGRFLMVHWFVMCL